MSIPNSGDVQSLGRTDDPVEDLTYPSHTSILKRLEVPPQVQYSIEPYYGNSRLRNESSTSGSGSLTESGGEFVLSTGTTSGSDVIFRSKEHTQYRSGLYGDAAFGVRLDGTPTGDQVFRCGPFGDDNGFGWGQDATSRFVFWRKQGTETKVRPADWWFSDQINRIGADFAFQRGLILHILFRWYGHGSVLWYGEPKFKDLGVAKDVGAHRRIFEDQVSLPDPNQQLRVEVENGSTAEDLTAYIGGRQFSLHGDGLAFERRSTYVFDRSGLSPSSSDTWEPVIAIRKKPTFRGRDNSVRVVTTELVAAADSKKFEVRVTTDASTDATYPQTNDVHLPEDTPDSETAVELQKDSDNTFTVNDRGIPVMHMFGGRGENVASTRRRVPFGADTEAVVWIRADSNGTTLDFLSVELTEQW